PSVTSSISRAAATTSCPRAAASATTSRPRRPAAPVTRILMTRKEPLRRHAGGAPHLPCRSPRAASGVRGRHGRGLLDLSGRDAARAYADPATRAFRVDDLHGLQVRKPSALGLVVRVADVVPRAGALATRIAYSSHLLYRLRFWAGGAPTSATRRRPARRRPGWRHRARPGAGWLR